MFKKLQKLSLAIINERLSKKGWSVIEGNYDNKYSILTVTCKNGHIFNRAWDQLRRLKECPECARLNYKSRDNLWDEKLKKRHTTKYTYGYVKESIESEGYTLLSTEYNNVKEKLTIRCSAGHVYQASFDQWKNAKHRCRECSINRPLNHEIVQSVLAEYGWKLLSNYTDRNSKLDLVCDNGHYVSRNWLSLVSSKFKCKECARSAQVLDSDLVTNEIELRGYKLMEPYERSDQKLWLRCPEGHNYYTTWDNFIYNGRRCTRCGAGTSNLEKDLVGEVEKITSSLIFHDRNLIYPLELDIVIPHKRVAIELNGLYWHSEVSGGKDSKYHLSKLEKTSSQGYRLITIFEDEYVFNRDIVLSKLRNILGVYEQKVFARQCIIHTISKEEANLFLEANHLQGGSKAKVRLGAFYEGELLAVMTFSGSDLSKSYKANNGQWELNRFCVKKGWSIPGVASKLLKYFERNNDWVEVMSFADRRWSDGGLYRALGFEFVHDSKPTYWYFKIGTINRYHRFTKRKVASDDPNLTEVENRFKQGYDRIWDCGHKKFIKYKARYQNGS